MDSTELYRQLLGVTTPWTVQRVDMDVAHLRVDVHLATILRWMQRFVPEFEKRWNRFARKANLCEDSRQVELPLPGRRSRGSDRGLAPECQSRCEGGEGVLPQGAGDARPGTGEHHVGRLRRIAPRGARTASAEPALEIHAAAIIQVLNNMIEQDHRGVKSRINPMLGFKVFDCAAVTIAGVDGVAASHPQGPVQSRPATPSRPSCACDLEWVLSA